MQRISALAFLGVIVLLLAFTAHESRSASTSAQKITDGAVAAVAKAEPRVEKTLAR